MAGGEGVRTSTIPAPLSMWVEHASWGDDPLPCHLTSLLWHAAALTLVEPEARAPGTVVRPGYVSGTS